MAKGPDFTEKDALQDRAIAELDGRVTALSSSYATLLNSFDALRRRVDAIEYQAADKPRSFFDFLMRR